MTGAPTTYADAYDSYLRLLREGEAKGFASNWLGTYIAAGLTDAELRELLRFHYRDRPLANRNPEGR